VWIGSKSSEDEFIRTSIADNDRADGHACRNSRNIVRLDKIRTLSRLRITANGRLQPDSCKHIVQTFGRENFHAQMIFDRLRLNGDVERKEQFSARLQQAKRFL